MDFERLKRMVKPLNSTRVVRSLIDKLQELSEGGGVPGPEGVKGDDGDTPVINGAGNWEIGGVDTGIAAEGIDGQDGVDGTDGQDGATPEIINGNWWIDGVDTGIAATGPKGDTGNDGEDGWGTEAEYNALVSRIEDLEALNNE